MKQIQFLFSAFIIALCSCNPEEVEPAYLVIDEIVTTANQSTQGTDKQEITDVWVFVNGSEVGVWPLPATVPVFDFGNSTVIAFAGIKNNNQTANRENYIMFGSDSLVVDLQSGISYDFTPSVTYKSNLTFEMLNDFDNTNGFEIYNGTAIFAPSFTDVFEGSRSLRVFLDEDNNTFGIQTTDNLIVAASKRDVYLEMHYKNEATFAVGLRSFDSFGTSEVVPVLNIGPKEDWEKIYIPIGDITSNLNGIAYRVLFESILPDSLETAEFYFDNLKLVYQN